MISLHEGRERCSLDGTWRYRLEGAGAVVAKNAVTATIAADSSEVADSIAWRIPDDARPGAYRVEMQVIGAEGRTLSENTTEIVVC